MAFTSNKVVALVSRLESSGARYWKWKTFACLKTNIIIPESVTQIGDECSFGGFIGCRKVKTIHVPASVKRILNDAFRDCAAKVTYEDKDSIEFFKAERF